jgi:hypothetical protein
LTDICSFQLCAHDVTPSSAFLAGERHSVEALALDNDLLDPMQGGGARIEALDTTTTYSIRI